MVLFVLQLGRAPICQPFCQSSGSPNLASLMPSRESFQKFHENWSVHTATIGPYNLAVDSNCPASVCFGIVSVWCELIDSGHVLWYWNNAGLWVAVVTCRGLKRTQANYSLPAQDVYHITSLLQTDQQTRLGIGLRRSCHCWIKYMYCKDYKAGRQAAVLCQWRLLSYCDYDYVMVTLHKL